MLGRNPPLRHLEGLLTEKDEAVKVRVGENLERGREKRPVHTCTEG